MSVFDMPDSTYLLAIIHSHTNHSVVIIQNVMQVNEGEQKFTTKSLAKAPKRE
jgi:hypothetical protein